MIIRTVLERAIRDAELLPCRRAAAHLYYGANADEPQRHAYHRGIDAVYDILDAYARADLPALRAAWLSLPKCRCCGRDATWYELFDYELPVGDSAELLCRDCGVIAFWAGLGASLTEDLPF